MQINEQEQVAIKAYQTNNPHVRMGETDYIFITQARICLAWINPEHVEKVLAVTRVCCGGSRKPKFTLANESDVRRWTNKGGR